MLTIETIRNADYHQQVNGPHGPTGDQWPCLVCGRGHKLETSTMLHLHGGGALIVTEAEAEALNAAGRTAEEHDRFAGRDGDLWGHDYAQTVTRSAMECLEKYGRDLISHHEAASGQVITYTAADVIRDHRDQTI